MAQDQIGSFIPTTNIWDPTEIYSTEVTSPAFKELLVRMYQNLNLMAISLNLKDTGFYVPQEFVTGQLFPPSSTSSSTTNSSPQYRQSFRKLISFGALPNTNTKTVAHGITIDANTIFTRIYGAASDKTSKYYLPLPYSSPTLVNNIELYVDDTNVTIITGADMSAYTDTYVIVEYLKF